MGWPWIWSCTLLIRNKALAPSGIRIPDRPVRILTTLSIHDPYWDAIKQTNAHHRRFITVSHFKSEVSRKNTQQSVRTSLRTRSVCSKKPEHLLLLHIHNCSSFWGPTKHINTFRGQNEVFLMLVQVVHIATSKLQTVNLHFHGCRSVWPDRSGI